MSQKISKHSKSFAWLFSIAFIGAFAALLIAKQFGYGGLSNPAKNEYEVVTYSPQVRAAADEQPPVAVDTSNWKDYQDERYGLKFKYAPGWSVRSITNKDGYYVIEIDPGARYDNFRVYISEDDFFALSGVPTTKTEVGGKEAVNLEGAVLGVKDNATYFTFDMGVSLSLKPYFQAMIGTVKFE